MPIPLGASDRNERLITKGQFIETILLGGLLLTRDKHLSLDSERRVDVDTQYFTDDHQPFIYSRILLETNGDTNPQDEHFHGR